MNTGNLCLYLHPSTIIPTHPRGLYTKLLIRRGTVIGEYTGKIISETEADKIVADCKSDDRDGVNPLAPALYFFRVVLCGILKKVPDGLLRLSEYDKNLKVYHYPNDWIIDAFNSNRNPLRYVNADHTDDKKLMNSEFIQDDHQIWLRALRDIPPDSEIIAHYGDDSLYLITENI